MSTSKSRAHGYRMMHTRLLEESDEPDESLLYIRDGLIDFDVVSGVRCPGWRDSIDMSGAADNLQNQLLASGYLSSSFIFSSTGKGLRPELDRKHLNPQA